MKKIKALTESRLNEISAMIGESFWDYPYEEGEGGLKPFFPNKQAMSDYMKTLVVAGIESGTFYSTDGDEGYILITDTEGNHPGFFSIIRMMRGMKTAIGGWKKLFAFLKAANCGDETLEQHLKKKKQKYIKVEMLIVTKEHQGQGYMRKLLTYAFKIAEKKNCPCILDTDAKGKCERYKHLGMKLEKTRYVAGAKIYDLIWRP
ncbi:GNAT family N-acetyltransferase [Ruminococcus albus]|uniref:Acetyltransferase (GNAT) family protein n=1 Tax=Ruminococcus albus TaxID=1264 RepID=A0A1H7MEE6_RUMAL|nr:GNAT family N-acetyltransferase [Ruminococcus albus]SEL09461.1 Acetyltransferase (GNAT) family protein [Ruminococcus albus]